MLLPFITLESDPATLPGAVTFKNTLLTNLIIKPGDQILLTPFFLENTDQIQN